MAADPHALVVPPTRLIEARLLPMPDTPTPPTTLDGWEHVESASETLVNRGFVTVTAHTSLYEDPVVREGLREASGVDEHGRFCLLGRVVITPQPPDATALSELVTRRAEAAFVSRLESRGFESVTVGDRRSLGLDTATARLSRFEAVVDLGSVRLAVEGFLAVWRDEEGYVLVGGVYPTAARGDTAAADAVGTLLDPRRYRDDLLACIRASGSR